MQAREKRRQGRPASLRMMIELNPSRRLGPATTRPQTSFPLQLVSAPSGWIHGHLRGRALNRLVNLYRGRGVYQFGRRFPELLVCWGCQIGREAAS